MSDRLNTTAKKTHNLDSTFKVSPLQSRGFGVQPKSEESVPATKAQLWESYQQAKQLNQSGANRSSVPIQAKLTIGLPGDKYEQEADSVADRVMAMSEPAQVQREELGEEEELQMKPLAETILPLVQREELPEEEEELQMKPEDNVVRREELPEEELQMKSLDNSIQREELPEEEEELQMKQSAPSTQTATPDLESQLSSSKGGGNPLSDDVRSFMEPRFGSDFSGVRVHTGSDAVQMNQGVNAQAFAHGSDIYFGAGKAPGKDALTAHELTHVVQQADSIQAKPIDRTEVRREIDPSKSTHLILRNKAEPTESVAGTLWATDTTGKILLPSLDDISQGGVGDCFLFAAMAAIVNTNPQQIVNMIQDNGNGSYTVTFKGIGFFSSAKQTVSANFTVGKHGNVTGRKALWPLIVEKAYAQQKGGINELDKGGNPGSAIDDLLNDGPSSFDPREESADYIMGKLAIAKQKKWPMTILAPKKEGASKNKKEMADNTTGLYFFHAYTIIDIDSSKQRIKLFNPWGRDHPNGDGWMDIEQVRKFFIEVNIND